MNPRRFARVALCWLVVACKDRVVAPPSPAPTVAISNPVAATLVGDSLELRGRGFGAPGGEAAILIESGARQLSVGSTSPGVRLWQDDRIAFRLPADAGGGTIRVRAQQGQSAPVPLEVYQYDFFAIPPTTGTNASPLAITLDDGGRLWVNQEFHSLSDLQHPRRSERSDRSGLGRCAWAPLVRAGRHQGGSQTLELRS